MPGETKGGETRWIVCEVILVVGVTIVFTVEFWFFAILNI